jgi:hypothetical protein
MGSITSNDFVTVIRSLERLTFAAAVRAQKKMSDEIPRSGWWVTGALNVATNGKLPDAVITILLSIEDSHIICHDKWSMTNKAQFAATKEAIFKGLVEKFDIVED